MAVPHILAGTAGGTTAQLDANWAYFADTIQVSFGRVGIGLSPVAKLHLSGAAAVLGVRSSDEVGGDLVYTENANAGNAVQGFVSHVGADVCIGNRRSDAGGLRLRTGDTDRLKLDRPGNCTINLQAAAPGLSINGDMVMNLTSNTNLRISVRGTDGVTRVANITLA